jgi:hypothetical protein
MMARLLVIREPNVRLATMTLGVVDKLPNELSVGAYFFVPLSNLPLAGYLDAVCQAHASSEIPDQCSLGPLVRRDSWAKSLFRADSLDRGFIGVCHRPYQDCSMSGVGI